MALSVTASVFNKTGTLTPTVSFGGGSTGVTYGTQTGNYEVIGDKLWVYLKVVLTSKGTDTGSLLVSSGLSSPYLPATASPMSVTFTSVTNGAEDRSVFAETVGGGSAFRIYETTNTTPSTKSQWSDTQIQNNTEIVISGVYKLT